MFGLIKKEFIGLLTDIVSASNDTKCMLLSNQKCMTKPIHINLHPNEYSQEFQYCPFAIKLDRCVGSCNTPTETEDLNLSVFHMITGINESKTLTKHISCECKCKVNVRKCNPDQLWNHDKCRYECRKCVMYVKMIMFGILLHVVVQMENIYQVSWMIQRLCVMKL